jgi:flagellar motor switch protein FliN
VSTMAGTERLTALSPVLGAAVAVRLAGVVGRPMEVQVADAGLPLPAGPGDLAVGVTWTLGGTETSLGAVSIADEDARILAGLGEAGDSADKADVEAFVRRLAQAVVTGLAEAATSLVGDAVAAEPTAAAAPGGDGGEGRRVGLLLSARVRDVFEAAVRVTVPEALAEALVAAVPSGTVAVRPARFPAFGPDQPSPESATMERVLDVPLTLTVELGRTTRRVKDLLQIVPGSVLELDRLAGEPLDIYANQEWVARGEVVVVDDTFAIRVTQVGAQNPLGQSGEGGDGWAQR